MTIGAFTRWIGAPIVLLHLVGCTTTNIEDIAPTSQMRTPVSAPVPEPRSNGDPNSATAPPLQQDYPNLNTAPQTAAPQFTDAERLAAASALAARRDGQAGATRPGQSAELRKLAQDRQRQASQGGVADQSTELRELARTHGDRVIEEIEGE